MSFFFNVLFVYSDIYYFNLCLVFLFNLSIIYWYIFEVLFLCEKRFYNCFFVLIFKCYYNIGIFCRMLFYNIVSIVDFY